jgi:hypothetical protein
MICPALDVTSSMMTSLLGIGILLLLCYFYKEFRLTVAVLSQKEQRKRLEVGVSYGFHRMEELQQVAS